MTATSQGATNRRKGHETERMVVRWLRQVGWPDACTTRAKLGHDGWSAPGDVSWHPLIVLEVKDVAKSAFPTWCRQAVAASAPGQVPCVVRRTRGVADVSQWRVRVRRWEWVDVLGQVPAVDYKSVHFVPNADVSMSRWVDVSMDELANAVAAVDRSGDR
mgnify:CR=1